MNKIKKLSAVISLLFLTLIIAYLLMAVFDSNSFLNNFSYFIFFLISSFTFLAIYVMSSNVYVFSLLNSTLLVVQLSPFLIYLIALFDVDLLENSWPLIFVGILLQCTIAYLSAVGFLSKGKKVSVVVRIGAVLAILIVSYTGVLFLLKVSVWSFYAYALLAVIPCYIFFVIAKLRE